MDCQNWETVQIKKTTKRSTASTKPLVTAGAALARRLEADDEGAPKPTRSLGAESRAEIVRLRTTAGQTQAQLNTACAFPVNTIRDIEAGKLCPNPAQLNVLNRVLRTSLKYATA